jgi:hypothetical protein
MTKREVAKALGFMLLGSLITIVLFVIWVSHMFTTGISL